MNCGVSLLTIQLAISFVIATISFLGSIYGLVYVPQRTKFASSVRARFVGQIILCSAVMATCAYCGWKFKNFFQQDTVVSRQGIVQAMTVQLIAYSITTAIFCVYTLATGLNWVGFVIVVPYFLVAFAMIMTHAYYRECMIKFYHVSIISQRK